ncbi:enoyl-CoA hydratase/isomerase family protein [Pseudonocardia benzenivorans]|uniref:Enoyl-CoA hydratase/isomerase family protein n=1 Tax=Pseudonocardia benzenivorans TaxID=228005 RepID=A0ABW3VC04_9PSEU
MVADSPAVLVERDSAEPAVAVVTMNRPDRHNALTVELKVALRDALEAAAADPSVRAVVLTGAGRSFCVGQDLGEHAQTLRAGTEFTTIEEHYNRITLAIAEAPKPVIAAVNGTCVGAGLGFALAADLRVSAAGATFSTAFAGIGLTADSGLSASLAHMVGVARATELLLLGERFTAEDAAAWGLVRIAPGEAIEAALELARGLAAGPTLAYAEIKSAVRFGAVNDLRAVLANEDRGQSRLVATADHAGAVEAFLAKQKPTFEGR